MLVRCWKPLGGATGTHFSRSTMTTSRSTLIWNWPEPGVGGPEASWDFYREAFKVFVEQFPIEDVEAIDAGSDKVLLHYRVDLTGQTSPGVDLIGTESGGGFPEYWVVTTIRQGRILRSHWFADRADALEAAGLSE